MLPDHLYLPPSYASGHFNAVAGMNRITTLIGREPGDVPIPQEARVSRLVSDRAATFRYRPRSTAHGVYIFTIDGVPNCNGATLKRRDSTGIWDTNEIVCQTGRGDTDVRLVETIM